MSLIMTAQRDEMQARYFGISSKMTIALILVSILAHFSHTFVIRETSDESYNDINSILVYSPKKGWMNDPNGLVYVNGVYHLFYQYNPNSNHWGNLSWGHAVGKDLVTWEEKGVALPFNETTKEMIFSGSAVYDEENSSNFGSSDSPPVVAAYTSHFSEEVILPDGSRIAKETQSQSIAYSLDKGNNWHYYDANPVIKSPPEQYSQEYKDFRDPDLFWYAAEEKWVMVTVIAKQKKALFYTSKNLKEWTFMSEFSSKNTPDAIWECPDVFEVSTLDGAETKWVMLVSTNAGSVAGGSGMHYHIGHFDGNTFTEEPHDDIHWLDYGTDFYAGVTWTDTGDDKFIIGWVNNWDYANKINDVWKGGQSIVRKLNLIKIGDSYKLMQTPVEALKGYRTEEKSYDFEEVKRGIEVLRNKAYEFIIELGEISNFSFAIEDENGNTEVEIEYVHEENVLSVRKRSVNPDDRGKYVRHESQFSPDSAEQLRLFVDNNTLTLFSKKGDIVFTEIVISNAEKRKFYLKESSEMKVTVTRWLLSKSAKNL